MTYLITQTFILLLITGLLGLLLGWYLTRIAASTARVSLHARLLAAEHEARELRAQLDAAVTAKRSCDSERRLLSDELADLRARHDAAVAAAEKCEALAAVAASPVASRGYIEADDLQQIKGIGPKIAGMLNALGIQRFEQIAEWTADDIERIDGHLNFKGRIERETWVAQARALLAARAAGG